MGTVIGGGLLGLEAAKALKDLGLETHIVEFAPRLRIDTPGEADYYRNGGILPYVLRSLLA